MRVIVGILFLALAIFMLYLNKQSMPGEYFPLYVGLLTALIAIELGLYAIGRTILSEKPKFKAILYIIQATLIGVFAYIFARYIYPGG